MTQITEQSNHPQSSEEKSTPEKFYYSQRKDWEQKINSMANAQRDIMNFANVQVDLYSNRHLAIDQMHSLMNLHLKINEKYKIARGEARKKFEAGDLKVKDINEQVDASTAPLKTSLDQISNQIEFFKEMVKNVDAMLYGIKYRLEFEGSYRRAS